MKKKTLILTGVLGAAAITIAASNQRVQLVEAADHLDSPAAMANAGADLTDLYAWMWDDGGTQAVSFVVAANPAAADDAAFPQNVHYAVNIDRGGTASQIICQFESNDNSAIRCWVGDATTNTIITGDPSSAAAPLTMGGIKIFAGARKDPFTFNLAGFSAVSSFVHTNAGGLVGEPGFPGCFDLSGAPPANGGTADTLAEALDDCLQTACTEATVNANNGNAVDFFAGLNVLALTVSVPLADIPGTGDILTVYASTHTR